MQLRAVSRYARLLAVLMTLVVMLQLVLSGRPSISQAAQAVEISGVPYQVKITTDDQPNSTRNLRPPNSRTVRPTSATFQVTYNGFSAFPSAQAAFQYAVDVWSSQLNSSVPIKVVANWSSLGGCGSGCTILGSAGPYTFYRDFPNAPQAGTFYPKALANSLAGYNINSGTEEIDASFNQDYASWYFGTDGNVPAGKVDFASVVLHELGHGLGFSGSMRVSSGSGSWGLGNPLYPTTYDRFTVNGSNQSLINTALFPNNSTQLGNQLISGSVFFNGPNANAANGGSPARLYAPNPWRQGSSISHFDETTYNGTSNALMTPSIGSGEVEHNPGPIMLAIFKDMGWRVASVAQAPNPPTGLTATAASGQSVNLAWTSGGGETGFKVERGASAGGPFSQIGTSGATTYTDSGLTPGTTYYYRVRATNATGDSAYTNVAGVTLPPNAPTNLTATATPAHNTNLAWTPGGGQTGFTLERALAAGGPFSQIATPGASATSYTDSGLTAGTTYYYRIKATGVGGDSAYSNIVSVTQPPNAPTGLTASAVSSRRIGLSWTSQGGGLTGFTIERSLAAGGPFSQVGLVNASTTTYTDAGLSANTLYYYRVVATNAGGNSDYSNVASATTNAVTVSLIVKIATDGGDALDGNTPDTLSYALKNVGVDQQIIFQLPGGGTTVTVSGALRPVPDGAAIYGGSCGTSGITITASGSAATTNVNGLTLNNALLTNIKVSKFGGRQIVAGSGDSVIQCSRAGKN